MVQIATDAPSLAGLATSTLFTLFALPTFYAFVHGWQERFRGVRAVHPAEVAEEV